MNPQALAARFSDAQTLHLECRGMAVLEGELTRLWHKLEAARPEVVAALAAAGPGQRPMKKWFGAITAAAETLGRTTGEMQQAIRAEGGAALSGEAARLLFAKVEGLRDQLLADAFPEITLPPRIDCADAADEHLSYGTLGRRCFIDVSPAVFLAPAPAVAGGLAHELAHISRDLQLGEAERERDEREYEHSKKYRHRVEREADLLVVERGWGRALLSFLDWLSERGFKPSAGGGLKRSRLRVLLRDREAQSRNTRC